MADVVFEKVRDLVADTLSIDPETVTEGSSLKGDLPADSLDLVEIVMAVEEEFDIEFPDEECEEIETVGHLVDRVKKEKGV